MQSKPICNKHAHHHVEKFGPLEVLQFTEEQGQAELRCSGILTANNLIVTDGMGDSDTNDDKDREPWWSRQSVEVGVGRPAGLSNGHVDPAPGSSCKY